MSTPAQDESLAVLQGGQQAEAVHVDGTRETVLVRHPPLRQLARYVEIGDDVPALVEFICDKPEGWADRLTDDSVFELFHLARSINDPRLGRWIEARRQTARNLIAVAAPREKESPSPASPPASPPDAPSLTGKSST